MTTAGFGDMPPVSGTERLFVMFAIVFGVVALAYALLSIRSHPLPRNTTPCIRNAPAPASLACPTSRSPTLSLFSLPALLISPSSPRPPSAVYMQDLYAEFAH